MEETNKELKSTDQFNILLLAIIFNPSKKKILIIRKNGDPEIGSKFSWGFPGTELNYTKDPGQHLKEKIKEKTGYNITNLGAVFTKVYPENEKLVAIYFLCEAIGGEEKLGAFYKEIEWVNPEELEKCFTTSFHPRLKEYILNLK